MIRLFTANDMLIELDGLRDAASDVYVPNATVTARVYDEYGNDISGPIAMGFVPGSNGLYRGVVENTLPLQEGRSYEVVVTAGGAGIPDGEWREFAVAEKRA